MENPAAAVLKAYHKALADLDEAEKIRIKMFVPTVRDLTADEFAGVLSKRQWAEVSRYPRLVDGQPKRQYEFLPHREQYLAAVRAEKSAARTELSAKYLALLPKVPDTNAPHPPGASRHDHFPDPGKMIPDQPPPPTVADIAVSLAFVGALVAVGFAGWFIAREIFAIIAPALAGLAAALVFLAKLAISALVVLPLGYFFLRPRAHEQAWMPPAAPRKEAATKCAPVVQQIIIVNPPT